MKLRRICALPLAAVAALAACSSSGNSGDVPANAPTDAAGLAAQLKSATSKITSAHITLDANLSSGAAITGQGDEQLSHGKLQALDVSENLSGYTGALRIIVVHGKTYAKLPASLNTSGTPGKPWVVVTPDSSNPVVRELASTIDSALSSASLGEISTFMDSTKSVSLKGRDTIDGVPTNHYSVVVDVTKLPSTTPGRSALVAAGVKTLPLELYVDDKRRPVQVTEQLKIQGQNVSTKLIASRYNQPVSIKPPPVDQVGS